MQIDGGTQIPHEQCRYVLYSAEKMKDTLEVHEWVIVSTERTREEHERASVLTQHTDRDKNITTNPAEQCEGRIEIKTGIL